MAAMIGLPPQTVRFARYAIVGTATFLIDFLLLWVFVELVHIHYIVSTALAFIIGVSFNYFLSRRWVFKHSTQTHIAGYLYFLKFAAIGMTTIVVLMWVVKEYTDIHYLIARVLIAGIVGIANYVANLYFNFKVAGMALD